MKGWLPVRLFPGARPERSGSFSVGWMEFGATRLAEPFFEETRARLAAAGARELETGVDALFRLASGLPPVRPAGIICHISRCGSTLLANALRTARDTVVVSEDLVTARLLQPFRPTLSPHLDRFWNDTRRQIAEAIFRFFAGYRTTDPAQLILKLPSFATVSLPLLRQWWPDVPCVIVIRDPEEVIVANVGSGWGQESNRAGIEEVFGIQTALEGVSPEAVCAQMLNSMLTSAIAAVGPGCYVVDYEDLKARVPAVARFFSVELPGDESLSSVMNTYSKDLGAGRAFAGDGRAKREKITSAVREAAQRWARGPYAELRAAGHGF